jgi:hypothetical protein
MGKQNIKQKGPGFVIYKAQPKSRKGVLKTYMHLSGGSASAQLMVRYTRADQLADYLAKRLGVSTMLARYTLYYRFVWEPGPASVYVGGAAVQVGTGTSGHPARGPDGGVVYNGLDASHVRLGTYTVNGDSVSLLWPKRIFDLAARRGVPRQRIPETFPANVSMASVAMMYDAVTDYTDALLNRVFGKIEDYSHRAMRTLIPASTPTNAAELEQFQTQFSKGFPYLIAKMIKRYARERMARLGLPGAKQARQAPEADGTAPMFATEREILAALIAQLGDEGSDTMALIEGIMTRSRRDIAEEVADAVAARAEIG